MAAKKFKRPQPKKDWKFYVTNRRYLMYAGLGIIGIAIMVFLIYANIRGSIGYDPWAVASDFAVYRQHLDRYFADHDRYPTAAEGGLAALTMNTPPGSDTPYLAQLIPSPADGEYLYESDGHDFVLTVRLIGKEYRLTSASPARTAEEIHRVLVAQ